jgi:hypothetical protein
MTMTTTMTCLRGWVVVVLLVSAAGVVRGVDIKGRVSVRAVVPGFSLASVRVVLRGGGASEPVATGHVCGSDGTFTLRGVAPGAYSVEVHAAEFAVDPERLEVRSDSAKIVRSKLWDERRGMLVVPLGDAPAKYFAERPVFNPLAFLKNPMVIMMGFSVVMMFVMPKLTANMAPEDRAQLLGDNKITTADGRTVDRDDLIPPWNPPSVRTNLRPPPAH